MRTVGMKESIEDIKKEKIEDKKPSEKEKIEDKKTPKKEG